jgi:hypothetical protein
MMMTEQPAIESADDMSEPFQAAVHTWEALITDRPRAPYRRL